MSGRQDDPVVVNTSDDRCWRRRGQTPDGHGLYGLEGSPEDDQQTLYLIGDLAAFGLRSMSMAFALPVPAGSVDHSSWEDPHDSPLHHRYAKGRDLPVLAVGECRCPQPMELCEWCSCPVCHGDGAR